MNIFHKKIPGIIGIVLIVVGIAVTTFLTKNGGLFITKAGPGIQPKDVRITNISDSSFTVSYLTDDTVIGTIDIGLDEANLSEQFLDDRDQVTQLVNKYKSHSITARNLNPNSSYIFVINSAGKKFNQTSYVAKTGSVIDDKPLDQNPITGKILLPDGTVPTDSIIYLSIGGAQKFSTLGKQDGNYTIPLNSLRNESLDSYYKIQEDDSINLEVFSQNLTSTINVTLSQANPIPAITLSNSYSFAEEPEASEGAEINTSFPQLSQATKSTDPKIISPKNSEGFNDSNPEFNGIAQPEETVEIEIHSDEQIKTTVKSDSSGNWNYRPEKPLSVGDHTITIKTKNSLGIIKTITQSFTVYAAGDQVGQTATPSSTLSPTPVSSPIPSLLPTLAPTLIPFQPASPSPTLPPTGSNITLILGIFSISFLTLGILIFFLPKLMVKSPHDRWQ